MVFFVRFQNQLIVAPIMGKKLIMDKNDPTRFKESIKLCVITKYIIKLYQKSQKV